MLLFVLVLAIQSTLVPTTAFAASDYDDVIQTTSQLKVMYAGHADLDVSGTYIEYFTHIITDDVAQYECSGPSSSGTDSTWCNQIIDDALNHGDWMISVQDLAYPIYAVSHKTVVGQFCDQKVTSITGATITYPSATYKYLWGNTTSIANCVTVSLGYQAYTNGVHLVVYAQGWSGMTTHAIQLGGTMTYGASTLNQNFVYLFTSTASYPEGYEGEQPPQGARYVAMGDSFSSGEGNPPFETGTDVGGVNECHRSVSAYPNWVSQTPSLNLGSMAFVTCSGATTNDVLGISESDDPAGKGGELAQVNALSDNTETVTITIGGNDIGFSDFARACAAPSSECDSSTAIYSTTMNKIHNVLPGGLEDVLTQIASRTSHAKVYVIGYPYVTPSSGLDSLPIQCGYLSSSVGDGADSLAARDVVTELNNAIGTAVTGFTNTVSDTEFTFIDPNASVDGSFDDHDVCQGSDSYFHNVTWDDGVPGTGYRARIFHPNVNGQYEYYKIVSGVMALS